VKERECKKIFSILTKLNRLEGKKTNSRGIQFSGKTLEEFLGTPIAIKKSAQIFFLKIKRVEN